MMIDYGFLADPIEYGHALYYPSIQTRIAGYAGAAVYYVTAAT